MKNGGNHFDIKIALIVWLWCHIIKNDDLVFNVDYKNILKKNVFIISFIWYYYIKYISEKKFLF